MDVLTPVPSSLLKAAAATARWSLGLVLSAWLVVVTSWGALHFLIVPRIDAFRPQLEARATQLIGAKVTIGGITAQSTGMIPAFELQEVKLFDAQGREALVLHRVLVSLSPRSLLGLRFEQIYIDQPQLAIRRAADGRVFVAGLDRSGPQQSDDTALNWFFSQPEFVIHNGTVQWTDELRGAPPLALQQLTLVVRNQGRNHRMRLDATPPAPWGERFSLMAVLRQPLLSGRAGQWRQWEGQLYGAFDRIDLSQLRRHADIGVDAAQGFGTLRAWADVSKGAITQATADVSLANVAVTLGEGLQPLAMRFVGGRLTGRFDLHGFEFSTKGLTFDTLDGLHWPGGNVQMVQRQGGGEIVADRLDLAALSRIAGHLPLGAPVHAALATYAPKGLVERLSAKWQGVLEAPGPFEARGRVSQLEVAADATRKSPGIRGATLDFDLTQAGGKGSLQIDDGALVLPGVFDDPLLPLTQLSAGVLWQIDPAPGGRMAVQLSRAKFSNADAQGELQARWHTSDPAKSSGGSRFPGVLDLSGTLSRGEGTRVHRYLPTVLSSLARDYVRDSVVKGRMTGVRFKAKGDLADLPFSDSKLGEFRISSQIQDATFAFLPRSLQPPGEPTWPALTQLSGELVIDRASLQIKGARASLGNLQVTRAEAHIADLEKNSTVVVDAEARGALSDMLGVVKTSPVATLTDQLLDRATASGMADLRLKLNLPLMTIATSTVQGSVILAGNDVQFSPDSPRLTRARGSVNFSERGFNLVGVQARTLGGDMRLEGGTVPVNSALPASLRLAQPSVVLRAQGTASAEGLRQARELAFVARLAQQASGSAAYSAVLGFRHGTPELLVTSNLAGMALNLPAPLNKPPEGALPLRLETALLPESFSAGPGPQTRLQDQLRLEMGRLASVQYVRDLSASEPRVIRGAIGVGLAAGESIAPPSQGVVANINVARIDLDAWMNVLSNTTGASLTANEPPASGAEAGASSIALAYLPTVLALRAGELTAGSRQLHNVVVGGSRESLTWRANLDARELNGYAEYRQPSGNNSGRVYARLARLTLAAGSASAVESLLDEQPASIPALDIVVDELELRGKKLGRAEIEAVNRAPAGVREWRLNKFNLIVPEARFSATGNWASLNAQNAPEGNTPPAAPRAAPERRRTVMNFKLDISDSGKLLNRFGMQGVIRGGKGQMAGLVGWIGSPLSPDYASMAGAFNVNMDAGQFLKADPGIAKLLGVLSLQSLPRRLALDFRDVFSEGFSFDTIRGDISIDAGIANTGNLQMKGVNAVVLMEGRADIARETQHLRVLVLPEVNAGTASLIASIINPAIGLGTFLAQFILRRPLTEAATQEFLIDGTWVDPIVAKVDRRAEASGTADKPGAPASETKGEVR